MSLLRAILAVSALILSAVCAGHAQKLRLAKIVTDNAVLQAETPCINGWASAGNTVDISCSNGASVSVHVSSKDGAFVACLPPQKPSFDAVTITVNSSDGDTVQLQNVLFGDVWACSGQSNMEFSLAEIFEAQEIIRNSASDHLRLFAVEKNASKVPLDDLVDVQEGWVLSSPQTTCGAEYGTRADYCEPHCASAVVPSYKRPTWGYFSAVCYLHGRALAKAPKKPIGLVETCWGGTNIINWSSPDALKQCNTTQTKGAESQLWNSMVVPLLNFPIKGTVWYQGEANSGSVPEAEEYACLMQAMIADWRKKWNGSHNMTFIQAQLAAYSGSVDGLPKLRQSQLKAMLNTPNSGMSVGIDLSDPGSPCGNVHVRNKTAIGERMAKISLNLAYGKGNAYLGPLPEKITIAGDSIEIAFAGAAEGPLTLRAINQTVSGHTNFQVVADGRIRSVSQATITGHTLRLVNVPNNISAVLYAYSPIPDGLFLYDAADLPATPFEALCDGTSCRLA